MMAVDTMGIDKIFYMLVMVVVAVGAYLIAETTSYSVIKSRRYKEFVVRAFTLIIEVFVLCCMVLYLLWFKGDFTIGVDTTENTFATEGIIIENATENRVLEDYDYIIIE